MPATSEIFDGYSCEEAFPKGSQLLCSANLPPTTKLLTHTAFCSFWEFFISCAEIPGIFAQCLHTQRWEVNQLLTVFNRWQDWGTSELKVLCSESVLPRSRFLTFRSRLTATWIHTATSVCSSVKVTSTLDKRGFCSCSRPPHRWHGSAVS